MFVADYVGDSSNDWLRVKQELVHLANKLELTGVFGKRHHTTKKVIINDLDREVMAFWKELTGVDLVCDESRVHDPSCVIKPKGWAIKERNEQRRKKPTSP